jgi:hypothetical protein
MRIIFTKHATLKLRDKESKILRLTKKKIKEALEDPIAIDETLYPHRKVGKLTKDLSLCVIYKFEKETCVVITFYPAEKGRYESKVLRRR